MALGVGEGGLAPQPAAHRPAGQGPGGRGQPAGVGGVDLRGEGLEQAGVVAEQLGLAGQHRHQVTAGDLAQQGEDLGDGPGCGGNGDRGCSGRRPAPGPRPRTTRPSPIAAGRAGAEPGRAGESPGPSAIERPPGGGQAVGPPHAAEAVQARAPEHGQQDRLGLIVHGVAGQDPGRQDPVAARRARASRSGPGATLRCGPRRRRRKRRRPRPRPRPPVRSGPQTVVDVDGEHIQTGPSGQDQQGQGVGAARDRQNGGRARLATAGPPAGSAAAPAGSPGPGAPVAARATGNSQRARRTPARS